MITNTASMMKFQVRDLLDHNLLERDLLVPHYEPTNLKEIVSHVVQLMESQSLYKNISIRFNYHHYHQNDDS